MPDDIKDPADPNATPSGGGDKKPDTVTREAHDRLLGEKKEAAKKLRETQAELEAYKAKEREAEEAAAKARGDFEAASKADKDRIKALEAETLAMKTQQIENRKLSSFVRGLGTQIDQKFLPLLDLDRIEVDDEGKPVEASVTKYVEEFKTQYALILAKPGNGNVPNAAPQGGGVGIPSYDEWKAMPHGKEKLDLMPKVMDALKGKK